MIITTIKRYNKNICRMFSDSENLEGRKKLDYDKASIKMMMQPAIVKFDIDCMKFSKQFHIRHCCKIFTTFGYNISLGEYATLNIDGNLKPLQIPESHEKIMEAMRQFWKEQDIDWHLLHISKKLDNVLNFLPILQQNSKWELSRFFLTFFAYYLNNSKQIAVRQSQLIMSYLCQRSYFTQNIIEYYKQIFIQNPLQINNIEEVSFADFQKLCIRIKILNSLAISNISLTHKSQQLNIEQQIEKYANNIFKCLQKNEILENALINDPKLWAHDILFQKYLEKTLNIIKRILQPTLLYRLNYHSDLFCVIFDKLYLYSDCNSADEVLEILEKFKEYISIFSVGNMITIGANLIFLCQKFGYTSRTLANFYYQKYLKQKFMPKSLLQPHFIKKNRAYNRNMLMSACQCLAVCEIVSDEINPVWRSLFIDTLGNVLQLGTALFPGIQSYIFQLNVEKVRGDTIDKNSIAPEFYKTTGQFYYQQSTQTQQMLRRLERQMKSQYNPQIIEHFSYPINLKTNNATRINVLFWNLSYYAQFIADKEKAFQIYQHINTNPKIIMEIQVNAGYPGLLEGMMKFSQLLWSRKNFNNRISNQLYATIQQHKNRFNTIFAERIQEIIQKQQALNSKTPDNIYYNKNIEHLSSPLCKKITHYSTNQQIQLNLINYVKDRLNLYQRKQNRLQKIVMEQMRNFFTKNSRNLNKLKLINNHLQFPYLADFLITFKGKTVTVFITDQNNEESKQESIEYFSKRTHTTVIKTQEDVKKIFKALTSDFYQ